MIYQPYASSYQCGRRLVAAGCPLDYLENLPRKSYAHRKRLHVQELGGYMESRVFDEWEGRGLRYLIGIWLGTDLPGGAIVSNWNFFPPWGDPHICWDYELRDIVPAKEQFPYSEFLNSPLSKVLNQRRRLTRGRPVEGFLCGRSVESIPESILVGATACAKLELVDDTGSTVRLDINLAVEHRIARIERIRANMPRASIFDFPDSEPRESPTSARPAPQALPDSDSDEATIAILKSLCERLSGPRSQSTSPD
ncbi:MAG: hypothetical protein WBL70_08685 [Candidatus Acidiferrales bacterium]